MHVFLYALMSKVSLAPVLSIVMVCFSKSTVKVASAPSANICCKNASVTVTGSTPLFNALFLKMSAKKLDTTTLNP